MCRENESEGFAQFSAGSVEGVGCNGCGAIAESCDGSLSSARPLADSDRLRCGGPVLPTAGIRAACRREGARPAAQPARTARRRTHAQDTVNPNRVRRSGRRGRRRVGRPPGGPARSRRLAQCRGPLVAQVDRRVESAVGRRAADAAEGVGSGGRVPPRSRVAVPDDGAVHGYAADARCMTETGSRVSRSGDEPGHAIAEPSGRGWRHLVRSDLIGWEFAYRGRSSKAHLSIVIEPSLPTSGAQGLKPPSLV